MPKDIRIQGGGLAACCCASLLQRAGHGIFCDIPQRVASPVIMLSEQTRVLLADVFGCESLFEVATPIVRRIVLWGGTDEPLSLPHSGLAIPESLLLDRLWARVSLASENCSCQAGWSVLSSKTALPNVNVHEFGTRVAQTYSVELFPGTDENSCWIEALEEGWLFLIPSGKLHASLIAVGGTADQLIPDSRLVAHQIAQVGEATGKFAAYPRVVTPLCGSAWLACGTTAIAFDPIAGEGAGHAIREGILASAVIRASATGASEADLLSHYSNRLLSGLLRHLEECCRFYGSVSGQWWQSELELMTQGLLWTQAELKTSSSSFRLAGFELQSIR